MDLNTGVVIYCLALAALACGSGYWLGRSHPVRFKGEKILIGIFSGGFVALSTYGLEKLMGDSIHPFNIFSGFAFFLMQGITSEITVQRAARRRNKQ